MIQTDIHPKANTIASFYTQHFMRTHVGSILKTEAPHIQAPTKDTSVAQIDEHTQRVTRKLFFSFDESNGETMTLVKDDNNKILRTIPDEAARYLADTLNAITPTQLFGLNISKN